MEERRSKKSCPLHSSAGETYSPARAEGVGLAAVIVGPAALAHVPNHGRQVAGTAREGETAGGRAHGGVMRPRAGHVVVLEFRADVHQGPAFGAGARAAGIGEGVPVHQAPRILGLVLRRRVRRHGDDAEARAQSAPPRQRLHDHVVAVALTDQLGTEIAPKDHA